jgi:hypothetical protein
MVAVGSESLFQHKIEALKLMMKKLSDAPMEVVVVYP